MSAWTPYQPSDDAPWDRRRVVHLHRRCVFGATAAEVRRDVADTPANAVSRVLTGRCRIQETSLDFEPLSSLICQSAVDSENPQRLKAWWIYRLLYSAHPLQERLTLMWHNHFATSNLKVSNLGQMRNQNQVFRQHACGSFRELLHEMIRDEALLRWLDAPRNRKGHPNENLARELMELFTLGVGNYGEPDVAEAARALTGWTFRKGRLTEAPNFHDAGTKTILGKSAAFGDRELVELLLDRPETARRLAWRLSREFFSDGIVSGVALDELAEGMRERRLDIRWALQTMLSSALFFSDANINGRVCDPTTYLIAPLRALQMVRTPSTLVLAGWLSRFGQDLFYPPNVGGWSGGRSWLATRNVLARTEYATAIAEGRVCAPLRAPDWSALLSSLSGEAESAAEILPWVQLLLTGIEESSDSGETSAESATRSSDSRELSPDRLNRFFVRLMTSPQAHIH